MDELNLSAEKYKPTRIYLTLRGDVGDKLKICAAIRGARSSTAFIEELIAKALDEDADLIQAVLSARAQKSARNER